MAYILKQYVSQLDRCASLPLGHKGCIEKFKYRPADISDAEHVAEYGLVLFFGQDLLLLRC